MPAAPGLADALLVVLRWLHAVASIVFLGWSAVLWLDGPPLGEVSAARRRFKEVTELTLLVLLATGAVLTFDRLSRGAGGVYAAVLVQIKSAELERARREIRRRATRGSVRPSMSKVRSRLTYGITPTGRRASTSSAPA